MPCTKDHTESDIIVKGLPMSQGSFERHKCASCAYEMGLANGNKKVINFDLQGFIASLEESQQGLRRHRSALEAYSLGFFHGLNGPKNHLAIKDKYRMAAQMRDFGLHMVGKGVVNATFAEMVDPYSHAMAIVHIANGFEILIKSRIVEEHPLLVFSKIPKEGNTTDGNIRFEDLIQHGQTIIYSELPERLWAATGYKITPLLLYEFFGKTRNRIIHFAIPNIKLSDLALEFTFTTIENAVSDWWGTSIIEYASAYQDDFPTYLFEQLDRLKIKINYDRKGKKD